MSMKNSRDTIGNRTRGLPACSSVPKITKMCHRIDWVRPQYLATGWYSFCEMNALWIVDRALYSCYSKSSF